MELTCSHASWKSTSSGVGVEPSSPARGVGDEERRRAREEDRSHEAAALVTKSTRSVLASVAYSKVAGGEGGVGDGMPSRRVGSPAAVQPRCQPSRATPIPPALADRTRRRAQGSAPKAARQRLACAARG